jgi:hypothetical protein
MSTVPVQAHRRRVALRLVELAVAIGVAVLLLGVVPELARFGLGGSPAPSGTDTALAPSGTPLGTRVPMMVVMSPDADCAACHKAVNGQITSPVIPVMAHPLAGWTDCTACHAPDGLVQTAPGHSGIHKSDCLVCHKPPSAEGSPPPRPHHVITGEPCITCHGKTAPLPTDMAGRQNCWICHVGTDTSQLFAGTSPEPPTASTPGPSASSGPSGGSGAGPTGSDPASPGPASPPPSP